MRETEQSIEDLCALYRSLGMSEETLKRAIQFRAIKAPNEMVEPHPLPGAAQAKRPGRRKRPEVLGALVNADPPGEAAAQEGARSRETTKEREIDD